MPIIGTYRVHRCICPPEADRAVIHGLDDNGAIRPCPHAAIGTEVEMEVTATEKES